MPGPKSAAQVCVSFVPGSVKCAVTVTGTPRFTNAPSAGLVIVTAGAALATVNVVVSETPSAVNVTAYTPSSVHFTVVDNAAGSAIVQAAALSTPDCATTVQECGA